MLRLTTILPIFLLGFSITFPAFSAEMSRDFRNVQYEMDVQKDEAKQCDCKCPHYSDEFIEAYK